LINSISKEVKLKCIELAKQGLTAREIYNQYYCLSHGTKYSGFNSMLKRWKRDHKQANPIDTAPIINKSVSYKDTGDMIFEGIIELLEGEPITPEIIMQSHNLDSDKWHVLSFKSNAWQSQVKGGKKITLWQSKITVQPKQHKEITFNDIDNYFINKDFKHKTPLIPFDYNINNEILEINYTDLHTGLLSWREETGADFDLDIIENRFKESIADIVRRCEGRTFKLIRFVTLGDIIHTDNDNQTTTNGTFQQVDGRIAKIFNKAVDMFICALDCLLELESPIEYVYLSGNHDRNTGYFFAKSLQLAYRNEPNITFDISPNPQKAKVYGNALVGYCHGDMSRKNMGEWLLKKFRSLYGNSKYAEIHSGHRHNKTEEEINGIKVITLNALCESSYWEHKEGYSSERALICYVWHETCGKRETWITNF